MIFWSMKNCVLSLLFSFLFYTNFTTAQRNVQDSSPDKYYLASIAFWNIENLYDTLNDPLKDDDEFTPKGAKNWYGERYKKKLGKLSEIISTIGDEDGPEILGVCEVENKKVLEDLISTPLLVNKRYKIVHFDSPDRRGVDVALIYKSNYFKPLSSFSITVKDSSDTNFITRDILIVTGILSNDTITFLVNHWPSRRGGGSEDKRILASTIARSLVDSVLNLNPKAKLILLGDFNDDPTNKSIQTVLRGKPEKSIKSATDLFNPMFELFKKGVGTLAHQDSWSLFDQIIMTQALLNNENEKYFYKENSTGVAVKKEQIQEEGRFQGYPLRTYSGNTFTNGYSDHFPVYIYLVQTIK